MGCAGSKLDDLQAVALCRYRASRLDDAIRLRYALAEAHVHYLKSLRSIGESLHFFFDSAAAAAGTAAASPLLPLPQRRKLDPGPIPAAEGTAALRASGHSHSHSGSHIDILSESESGSPLSGDESPFHAHHRDFDLADGGGYGPPQPETQYIYNYMRSQPPAAAVTYEQPPPASMYMSDPSTSSAPAYGYAYPYDYAGKFAGAGGAGFFGSLPQGGYYASSPPMPPAASTSGSRAPPPPPSPPQASTWDFFNPFETFERFYPAAPPPLASYTPSRDSREVREEEGIPELEEEEVVKEVSAVHGGGGGYAASGPPSAVLAEDEGTVEDAVYKNVVGGGEPSVVEEHRPSVAPAYKAVRASLGTADAVREIKLEFERAADSGRDVAKMLEAGKLPYHRRNAVNKGCHFSFLGLKIVDLVSKDHLGTRYFH